MSLAQPFRSASAAALFLGAACFAASAAAAEKIAVFEFKLLHGSQVPGAPQHPAAEQKRLEMITGRLRDHLARSGRFEIVDTAPVAAKARNANLRACGNCADDYAGEVGAAYSVTGDVFKVSELILSINVYVHRSADSLPVAVASVDLRGNTDESWRRGIDYLYKNVLASRLEKLDP
jgi:hypothetical protein